MSVTKLVIITCDMKHDGCCGKFAPVLARSVHLLNLFEQKGILSQHGWHHKPATDSYICPQCWNHGKPPQELSKEKNKEQVKSAVKVLRR